MRLDDPALDTITAHSRDLQLLAAVKRQIAFMRAEVPFWRDRLSKSAIDESKIESLSDLARVPILSKAELRTTRPSALLPDVTRPSPQLGENTDDKI